MKRGLEKVGSPDAVILAVVLVLLSLGVLLVFDASYAKTGDAEWAGNDIWYMAKRQIVYACIGLLAMFIASRIRMQALLKWTLPLLAISIVLLIMVLVPGIGTVVNGARRWIRLGPISIQPSEIAKLALVLYLAGMMAKRKMQIQRINGVWYTPIFIIGIISLLVFVEPDLGTAFAIVLTCFVMLYAGGAKKRHLFAMASIGALFVGLAVLLEPYRLQRVYVWLDPWKSRYGEGYQIVHSLIALGTGGWRGVGLCEGREKLYLPAASTDFIMATLSEEAGLIGGLILLSLFLIFTYRGLDIARRCKSSYGNLLAVGITSMISIQTLVNVAVVSAAIPATGVPLPFISYGGSSLVLMMVSVGVLLAVSGQTNVELEEQELYENSLNGWRDRRSHISRNKRRPGYAQNDTRRRTVVRR